MVKRGLIYIIKPGTSYESEEVVVVLVIVLVDGWCC